MSSEKDTNKRQNTSQWQTQQPRLLPFANVLIPLIFNLFLHIFKYEIAREFRYYREINDLL